VKKEQAARAGYEGAHRNAEVARRVQGKKRLEITEDEARREQRALDETATLRFNTAARRGAAGSGRPG
jgi:flagellar biosynthesis chaperone FliJ